VHTDRRRTAFTLLVIAAITYSGLPWEAVAGFPLDPARSYLSELAAQDQPAGLIFRALDGLTGVLVLIALALGSRMPRCTGLTKGSAFALAAFAALTIVDASSPMACATSSSVRCAAADAANALGLPHQIHTVSSAGALAAAVVSAVLLVIAVVRDRARRRAVERGVLVAIVGMLIGTTVLVTVLAMLSTADGRLVDGGGIVQRAQVLVVSAYLVAFGIIAGRPYRPDASRPHAHPAGVR